MGGTTASAGTAGVAGGAGLSGGANASGGADPSGGADASGGSGGSNGGGNGTGGGPAGGGGSAGAAIPSAGCGSTAVRVSGRFTIDVSGTQREYILKLPASYDANHPHKLVFTFHGAMYSAQTVADGGRPGSGPYYGIEAVAGDSTIFVAPQAASSWSNTNGRDLAYVDAMMARFKSELCIDTSRLFLVGFSAGAMMSIAIACAESGVFRGVVPMSGSLSLAGTCGGTHAIAYWGSHGIADPTIAISAGRMVRDTFRTRNHCTATTTPEARSGCVSFTGCDAGYATQWCEFDGVHQPPPYAGEAIWAFINQF